MRHGCGGAIVIALIFAFQVGASPCSEILAKNSLDPSLVFDYRPPQSNTARLKDLLPEYDPQTDLLFHFLDNTHASFIVGGRRLDWGTEVLFNSHSHHSSAPIGVVVLSRIGKQKVQELVSSIDAKAFFHFNAVSCHHSELAFLQKHGIFVSGGLPFTGVKLFKRLVENGFVSETGTPYPSRTFVLHPWREVTQNVWRLIRNSQGTWIWLFLHRLELRVTDFAHFPINPNAAQPEAAARQALLSGNFGGLDEPAWDQLIVDLDRFESELYGRLRQHFGVSPEKLLEHLADYGPNIPPDFKAAARGIFLDSINATLRQ